MAEDTQKNAQQEAAEAQKAKVEETAAQQDTKEGKKSRKDRKSEADAKKLAELTDNLAKEKNDYLRLMAEFETFRRRSAEDKLNLVASAAADTIKGLLPVLDDCERAIQMLENCGNEAAKEGTTLIFTKLMDYLKTRGLAVIEAKGKDFDTDFHEAVTQFPAPSEELKGKVIDVVQTGYTLNGKVLRFAKVVVGA